MILNKTKKQTLVNDFKICKNDWVKARGLMFSRKRDDYALVFEFEEEQKVPLHMFFVFFSIDVLFLDANKKVVDIKKDFKPFTIYNTKKKVKYVIELPSGVITESNTSVKDLIEF